MVLFSSPRYQLILALYSSIQGKTRRQFFDKLSPLKQQTKKYNSIDIMKFICAILVICIHTNPISTYNKYLNFVLVNVVARIAVPFFFITSSYLFFRKITLPISKDPNNWFHLVNYIKRILKIYITWSAIYFFYTLYVLIKTNNINFKSLILYVRDFIFIGSYFHLWYFPALIFSIITIYLLLKYFSIEKVLILSTIFYVCGLFGDSYYGIIKSNQILLKIFQVYFEIFGTTRNGLFFGFMFVSLGIYVGKHTIAKKKSKIYLLISFGLLTVEVLILEYFNIQKDYNMLIFLVPATLFLFTILININIKDNKIYKYLRNSSTLIYGSHIIFTILLPKIFSILGLSNLYANSMIKFVLILASSLIFSFGILLITQSTKFQWLKILY